MHTHSHAERNNLLASPRPIGEVGMLSSGGAYRNPRRIRLLVCKARLLLSQILVLGLYSLNSSAVAESPWNTRVVMNLPTPATLAGSTQSIVEPGGNVVGQVAVKIPQLGATEILEELTVAMAGRVGTNDQLIRWVNYIDDFKMTVYEKQDYLANEPSVDAIDLRPPVWADNNVPVALVADGNTVGTIPVPGHVFGQIQVEPESAVSHRQNNVYLMKFLFTDQVGLEGPSRKLLPQTTVRAMRSGDTVIAFHVESAVLSAGGIRVVKHVPNTAQYRALFGSGSQPRTYTMPIGDEFDPLIGSYCISPTILNRPIVIESGALLAGNGMQLSVFNLEQGYAHRVQGKRRLEDSQWTLLDTFPAGTLNSGLDGLTNLSVDRLDFHYFQIERP